MTRRTRTLIASLSLVAILAPVGCSNYRHECAQCTPKAPAPVKSTEPAKTVAAAPAPSSSSSGAILYYPTGRREGSALMVEKFVPASATANVPFEYSLKATNISGGTLSNVMVTDGVPAGFTVASMNPTATRMDAGNATWDLGELAAGQSKTIVVRGQANASGTLVGCTSASYAIGMCSSIPVVSPALAITKAGPAQVIKCDPWKYTITVTNTGDGSAANVKVTDNLPSGVTTTDNKSSVTLDAGTLGAKQSKAFDVMVKADKTGRFENSASAVADGGLKAESTKVTTVVVQPVLTLKAECPAAARVGSSFPFKFTVGNTGDAACDTTVTAPVPAGTTFVSADNGGTASGGTVTWRVAGLAPGQSRTVSMTCKSATIGQIAVNAKASCGCATEVAANCSTGTTGSPDIGTLVTDDDGVVNIAANHAYRCEVKNQGEVPLTNVQMVFTMPAEYTFVSTTGPAPTVEPGKLTFKLGTLGPKDQKAWSVTIKSNKSGEFLVTGVTTCAELRSAVRDDEVTSFVD